MIEGADFFVRITDFPVGCGCDGMTVLNDDGTYSVYLNARTSREGQKKAMDHEYDHMAHDDMHGEKPIETLEEALR